MRYTSKRRKCVRVYGNEIGSIDAGEWNNRLKPYIFQKSWTEIEWMAVCRCGGRGEGSLQTWNESVMQTTVEILLFTVNGELAGGQTDLVHFNITFPLFMRANSSSTSAQWMRIYWFSCYHHLHPPTLFLFVSPCLFQSQFRFSFFFVFFSPSRLALSTHLSSFYTCLYNIAYVQMYKRHCAKNEDVKIRHRQNELKYRIKWFSSILLSSIDASPLCFA